MPSDPARKNQLKHRRKERWTFLKEILSEKGFRKMIRMMNDGFIIVDRHAAISFVNDRVCRMTGYSQEELIGKHWRDLIHKRYHAVLDKETTARRKGAPGSYEAAWNKKNGDLLYAMHSAAPFYSRDHHFLGAFFVLTDISAIKESQHSLEKREKELKEANLALRALLKNSKAELEDRERRIIHNMRVLVTPFLNRLKRSRLDPAQKALLDRIEGNLDEFLSSFSTTLSSSFYQLSPAEIRIATLIRRGDSSREIARLLHLSPRTVEVHRTRIRNKLRLTRKRTNLRSFLLTLHLQGEG